MQTPISNEFHRRIVRDLVQRLQDECARWLHTSTTEEVSPSLFYLCRDVMNHTVLFSNRTPIRTFQPSFPVQIDSDFYTCKAAGIIPYRVDPVRKTIHFLFHTFLLEENLYKGIYTDFGGKVEFRDRHPRETALREFFEESRFLFGHNLEDVPGMLDQYCPGFQHNSRIFLYNPSSKYMVYFWRLPINLRPPILSNAQITCQWVSHEEILYDDAFQQKIHFRIRHHHLRRKVLQILSDELSLIPTPPVVLPPPGPPAPMSGMNAHAPVYVHSRGRAANLETWHRGPPAADPSPRPPPGFEHVVMRVPSRASLGTGEDAAQAAARLSNGLDRVHQSRTGSPEGAANAASE